MHFFNKSFFSYFLFSLFFAFLDLNLLNNLTVTGFSPLKSFWAIVGIDLFDVFEVSVMSA
jgi:hypothetical protein